MKLWIDDFREPPDSTWTWAKTLRHAFDAYCAADAVEIISFDHDLGILISFNDPLPLDQTTMPLARLIEAEAARGVAPPKWQIHSMNPVGKANLKATLEAADRIYSDEGTRMRVHGLEI